MATANSDDPVTIEQVLALYPAEANLGSKAGMEKVKLVASGMVWAARERELKTVKTKGKKPREGVIFASADLIGLVCQWLCKWGKDPEFIDRLAEALECPSIQVELAVLLLRERRSFLAYKVEAKKREKHLQQALDTATRR